MRGVIVIPAKAGISKRKGALPVVRAEGGTSRRKGALPVLPAKAGISRRKGTMVPARTPYEIPACAGMTDRGLVRAFFSAETRA